MILEFLVMAPFVILFWTLVITLIAIWDFR